MNQMTIQQILNQKGINSPSSMRIGFKELKKLRQLGFRTYPNRPLSYSSLKEFSKSPLHYIEYLTKPSVSSQPMIAGKLFEALLFEKDIETDFLVFEKPLPDKDFRNKENKQARSLAFLEAATNGKEVVESFEYQRILGIADQAKLHPFWKRVKKYAFKHPDKKIIIEPSTRLKLTGIPDLAFNRGKIGVDIKFVGSVAEFRKRIFGRTYAYWIQAAMYSLIFGFREFYFFAVQSEAHHYAQAFHIDSSTLEIMKDKLINEILIAFKYSLKKGFLVESESIELPDYFIQWRRLL